MLIEYYFEIQYTKGIDNAWADALSRKAKLLSRNPTAGASIGEPRALVYTSRTAYVSYA